MKLAPMLCTLYICIIYISITFRKITNTKIFSTDEPCYSLHISNFWIVKEILTSIIAFKIPFSISSRRAMWLSFQSEKLSPSSVNFYILFWNTGLIFIDCVLCFIIKSLDNMTLVTGWPQCKCDKILWIEIQKQNRNQTFKLDAMLMIENNLIFKFSVS